MSSLSDLVRGGAAGSGAESSTASSSGSPQVLPFNPDHLSHEIGDSRVWHVKTCVQAIISQARLYPSAIALRGPKSAIDGTFRELSYTDLIRNAHTLMKRMISFFVNGKTDRLKGKVIAILLPRDVDYVGENQHTSIRLYDASQGMQ